MTTFLRRNLVLKIIALSAAVLLWLYVTYEQAPTEQATKTVKLDVRQLKPELMVVGKPETVKVKLQGTKNAFNNISDKDITAFVDLSDAREGNNDIAVQVKTPEGVKVLETLPLRVTVVLDSLQEKQVPVKIKVTGNPAPGYTAGTPKINPTIVTIKGPNRYLKLVDSVWVDIDLSGAQQNINLGQNVRLSDKNIDPRAIEANPMTVQVTVAITKGVLSKTLPLKYRLNGDPATGFQVGSVSLSVDQVTVLGTKDILDSLTELNLEPIDITGVNSDVTKDAKIVLPAGVTSQNINTIKVSAKIIPKPVTKANP